MRMHVLCMFNVRFTILVTACLVTATVPQQRPAMSEEAAAAIDADLASGKASGSKAQKKVTDSARGETNGYHNVDGEANRERTIDASQVAEKVEFCMYVICPDANSLGGNG